LVPFGVTGDITLPSISMSGDYALNENITVGGMLGYFGSKDVMPTFFGDYEFKYSYMIIAARGTYHYDFIENIETYGGVLLGYNIANSSIEAPSGAPQTATPVAASAGGIALGLFAGG